MRNWSVDKRKMVNSRSYFQILENVAMVFNAYNYGALTQHTSKTQRSISLIQKIKDGIWGIGIVVQEQKRNEQALSIECVRLLRTSFIYSSCINHR